jgi:acetylornithine deacetylase/succinyl-diaminopimelate desuccinylase-like protein
LTTYPDKAIKYINENYRKYIDILKNLVEIPTVSATNTREMMDCASLLSSILKEQGARVEVKSFGGHPLVLGEIGSGSNSIVIYNHYDVQPPEPLESWDTPPFELTTRDGKLYGRGASDNKGNIAARLGALDAVLPFIDELGLRIKFVFEGEEEVGSPTFPKAVEEKSDFLAAQGGIWETGYVGRDGRLGITLGFKGMLYIEIIFKGAARDTHSGNAPLVPNPAWDLVRMLTHLKDAMGRILVPGFHEGIKSEFLEDAEKLIEDLDPKRLIELKKDLQIEHFVGGLEGIDAFKALMTMPSLNICGLYAGYTGKGAKTVIPSYAGVKIDIRPVPGQDPNMILENLKRYLKDLGFGHAEVNLHSMYPAGYTKPGEKVVEASIKAAERVYGVPPVVTPLSGGSGPIYLFTDVLKVPMTGAGVGYYGSRSHAPNENIRVEDFINGMKHVALLLIEYASMLNEAESH